MEVGVERRELDNHTFLYVKQRKHIGNGGYSSNTSIYMLPRLRLYLLKAP